MHGTHYILSLDGQLFDFSKGANTISGVYLLASSYSQPEKYNIKFSQKERSLVYWYKETYLSTLHSPTKYKKSANSFLDAIFERDKMLIHQELGY